MVLKRTYGLIKSMLGGPPVTEIDVVESGDFQPQNIVSRFQDFETSLMGSLHSVGLPSTGVLIEVPQRARVFDNIEQSLSLLPEQVLQRSMYLSKFLAAVAAGLFDAALNYLWDETIGELRRRVAAYDLSYFYDLAVGAASDNRKHLSSEEDLPKVTDYDLIQAANKIGLVSDVGYHQLDVVRYMRNHASAAHPNQNDIRAMQLLNFLETCIIEVMTLPQNAVVVEIKKLLSNIKTSTLTKSDSVAIGITLDRLPPDQADNLANGLFGIYTRTETETSARENIRLLMPSLWQHTSEDVRSQFGIKTLRFTVNQENQRAAWAKELLDTVDGTKYLPEELRTSSIDQALDDLLTAHTGWNNFSTEVVPARILRSIVGTPPNIPAANEKRYVHDLVYVFLTNGHGVSHSANTIYVELLQGMTPEQSRTALLTFTDTRIASQLQTAIAQKKFRELLTILETKLIGRRAKQLHQTLSSFPGNYSQARHDSKIKSELASLAI